MQTVGELYDGVREAAVTGSGFLIGDRFLLTNNHVVPDLTDRYRTVTVDVRLGSREAAARPGTVIARDPALDLALVEIEPSASPEPFCPVSTFIGAAKLPPGSRLYVIGFPLDQEVSIIDGLLSSHTSPGRWQTNSLLNVGNSGGPVFSARGYMVGIAVGGVTSYEIGGQRQDVDGVNYFIPSVVFETSPVGAALSARVPGGCWQTSAQIPPPPRTPWSGDGSAMAGVTTVNSDAAVALMAEMAEVDAVVALTASETAAVEVAAAEASEPRPPRLSLVQSPSASSPPAPPVFSRSFTISAMKDDHPVMLAFHERRYSETYRAAAGYRIQNCLFRAINANHESGVQCAVAADGRSAILSYRLRSGPATDRWRGWLFGSVTLNQVEAR